MHGRRPFPLTHPNTNPASAVFPIERMGLINCDTQKVLFKSEGLTTATVAFIRLSMRQVGHQSDGLGESTQLLKIFADACLIRYDRASF